jgi:hypothetical protein
MMVKSAPTSPLILMQSDFLFQFLTVTFNAPSHLRVIDNAHKNDVDIKQCKR